MGKEKIVNSGIDRRLSNSDPFGFHLLVHLVVYRLSVEGI